MKFFRNLFAQPMWVVAWMERIDGLETNEFAVMPKSEVKAMIDLLQSRSEVYCWLTGPVREGSEPHWEDSRPGKSLSIDWSFFALLLLGGGLIGYIGGRILMDGLFF